MMQQLHFGKLENLTVTRGEPIFSPALRITQEIKLGPDSVQNSDLQHTDFVLKIQVIDLFSHFDLLKDGSIVTIECRHGLPFRLIVERDA